MKVTYSVEFDDSPVYELTFSFLMFKRPFGLKFLKALDIGVKWNEEMDSLMGETFSQKVKAAGDLPFLNLLELMIYESPQKKDVTAFLNWLDQLSVGTIYEILAPYLTNSTNLPMQLDEERKQCVEFLREWNEKYYSTLPFQRQIKEVATTQNDQLLQNTLYDSEAILRKLTEGIVIEPQEGLEKVVLTPTIHYRPLSVVYVNRKIHVVRYPFFDGLNQEQLEITRITNIGRALSDQNRLEMLRLFSTQKLNLTEIAQRLQTTKANVHHHLVFLRMAGLLKIHVVGEGKSLYYSLNTDFSEALKKKLDTFIRG
ncbi:ArsR/SmtB family transcription factor [Pseudoneobacillus sp. C159]